MRTVAPTHPGDMLREDFLPDFGLTRTSLASAIGVPRQTVNDLLNEKRSLSSLMALRLAKLFGTSAEFRLQAPQRRDLREAGPAHADDLAHIETLPSA